MPEPHWFYANELFSPLWQVHVVHHNAAKVVVQLSIISLKRPSIHTLPEVSKLSESFITLVHFLYCYEYHACQGKRNKLLKGCHVPGNGTKWLESVSTFLFVGNLILEELIIHTWLSDMKEPRNEEEGESERDQKKGSWSKESCSIVVNNFDRSGGGSLAAEFWYQGSNILAVINRMTFDCF